MKTQEEHLGSKESQPHTRNPSPGFQYQEGKSPQLLAAKTNRDWVGGRNFSSPKQFLLKHPCRNLFRLTPSELQQQNSSLSGTSGIEGEAEAYGIKVRAGGQKGGQRPFIVPFLNPPPTEPQSWQAGAISESPSTSHLGNPLRLQPSQFMGPPKLLTVIFPYEWLVLAYASQLPNSCQRNQLQ